MHYFISWLFDPLMYAVSLSAAGTDQLEDGIQSETLNLVLTSWQTKVQGSKISHLIPIYRLTGWSINTVCPGSRDAVLQSTTERFSEDRRQFETAGRHRTRRPFHVVQQPDCFTPGPDRIRVWDGPPPDVIQFRSRPLNPQKPAGGNESRVIFKRKLPKWQRSSEPEAVKTGRIIRLSTGSGRN